MSIKSSRLLALRAVMVFALALLIALVPVGGAFAAETTATLLEEAVTESAAAGAQAQAAAAEAAEKAAATEEAKPAPEATVTEAADTKAEAAPKQAETTTARGDESNAGDGKSADESGPYDSTSDGSPSENGNGGGGANGKPCAGCVGDADDKNPPGQLPGPDEDGNNGYECDNNNGVGKTNPAHSGCRTPDLNPAIHLEKDGPARSAVGGTVTYTFKVTNVGEEDLTDVYVTDPMLGGRIAVSPASLPAGSSGVVVTAQGSKDHTIAAGDVTNGKVHNTATAHGTDPSGDKVTDDDDHIVDIPEVVERKHSICHATGSDSNPFELIGPAKIGIIEGHVGDDHQDGRDIIPPFVNSAGETVSQNWDAAGQAIFEAGCEVPVETPENSIHLEKGGQTEAVAADEQVTYTFEVTNTGEQTLTDVHITDAMITTGTITVEPSTLAPGQKGVATATYTVKAGDIVNNEVHNTAWAIGTTPADTQVRDDDDHRIPTAKHEICHATGQPDKFVKISPSPRGIVNGHLGDQHHDGRDIIPPFVYNGTTYSQNWPSGQATYDNGCVKPEIKTPVNSITLEKDGPDDARVGDRITYTFDVKNTGEQTLANVHITDDLITDEQIPVDPPSLAPGETGEATADYIVREEDLEGEDVPPGDDFITLRNLPNEATVHGTTPAGGEVLDVDDHDVIVPSEPFGPPPGIELIKDGPARAAKGERITYTFSVKNTALATLYNVHVVDPKLGVGRIAISPSTLEAGQVGTGSATYTVTAADAKAERVDNIATAFGTPPRGGNVSDTDDHTVLIPRIVESRSGIRLEKSGPESARVGDTIIYRFRATNIGTTTLTNVTISDAKLGLKNLAVTPSTLAPGESGTASASYKVTPADGREGSILNTAIVTGQPPAGPPVTDRDRHTTLVPDEPRVCCERKPPLPATGMDSATTLLLAFTTLLFGLGMLRMAKKPAPATPQTWSIRNDRAPAGWSSPAPVNTPGTRRGKATRSTKRRTG